MDLRSSKQLDYVALSGGKERRSSSKKDMKLGLVNDTSTKDSSSKEEFLHIMHELEEQLQLEVQEWTMKLKVAVQEKKVALCEWESKVKTLEGSAALPSANLVLGDQSMFQHKQVPAQNSYMGSLARMDLNPRVYLQNEESGKLKYRAMVDFVPRLSHRETNDSDQIDLGGGFSLRSTSRKIKLKPDVLII